MRYFYLLLLFLPNIAVAQYQAVSSADILLQLQKLNTIGSVLYIAAHPDDENTRLLGYLANEQKVYTTYLSLTRGDGGQNLIGKEQGAALGLIRTNELVAARNTDKAMQTFSRAYDFGYSKTPEETFEKWKEEEILKDVIKTIRTTKPDVIFTRFPTNGDGGHGHHTASAMLAITAFDMAGNKDKFTYQLNNVTPWQSKRLYWNAWAPEPNEIDTTLLKLNVGVYNNLLGKSYTELSAESRSNHKSQGFGSTRTRGEYIEYFKYYKGDSAKQSIFEGMDFTWKRFSATASIEKDISEIINNYNALNPNKSTPALVALYKKLNAISTTDENANFYIKKKMADLQTIIVNCAGIFTEVAAEDYSLVNGDKIKLTLNAIARNATDVTINNISINNTWDSAINYKLKPNILFISKTTLLINNKINSNPYWLQNGIVNNKFVVNDITFTGEPINTSIIPVVLNINILGQNFSINKEVVHRFTDPVRGEVYRNIEILPKVTLNFKDKNVVFAVNPDKKVATYTKTISLIVKANTNNVKGNLYVINKSNNKVSLPINTFEIAKKNDETKVNVNIELKNFSEAVEIAVIAVDGTDTFTQSIQRIDYEHIPNQFILKPASIKIVPVVSANTSYNIAYVKGAGDDVASCLEQINYNVKVLDAADVENEDLSKYKAVIMGIRAYNTNELLFLQYTKLKSYVKDGGNLIVQYNTNSRVGPLNSKIGPYPFTISRDRVTNENAIIKITQPNHPMVNKPNKITDADFDNWVQERGLYFASGIDSNYTTIFAMQDPGEKELTTSTIITAYGKGNFVYTGLAFFRQLPAGVPGAYRLFSNIIELPQNKDAKK